MYLKREIPIDVTGEFLASEKVVAFTHTVVATGITADEYGRKIVPKGCLVAESGALVTLTDTAGTITFSEVPIGITMDTYDVTNGDEAGALLVEGYVDGVALSLNLEYSDIIGAAIHEALPEIKVR